MKTLLLKKKQHNANTTHWHCESMLGRFLRRKTLPALHMRFVPQHAGKWRTFVIIIHLNRAGLQGRALFRKDALVASHKNQHNNKRAEILRARWGNITQRKHSVTHGNGKWFICYRVSKALCYLLILPSAPSGCFKWGMMRVCKLITSAKTNV